MCPNTNIQGTKDFAHQFISHMLKPHMSFYTQPVLLPKIHQMCWYPTLLLPQCPGNKGFYPNHNPNPNPNLNSNPNPNPNPNLTLTLTLTAYPNPNPRFTRCAPTPTNSPLFTSVKQLSFNLTQLIYPPNLIKCNLIVNYMSLIILNYN